MLLRVRTLTAEKTSKPGLPCSPFCPLSPGRPWSETRTRLVIARVDLCTRSELVHNKQVRTRQWATDVRPCTCGSEFILLQCSKIDPSPFIKRSRFRENQHSTTFSSRSTTAPRRLSQNADHEYKRLK